MALSGFKHVLISLFWREDSCKFHNSISSKLCSKVLKPLILSEWLFLAAVFCPMDLRDHRWDVLSQLMSSREATKVTRFLEIKDDPKCSWNSKTHTFGRAPSVHQSDLFIKEKSIPTKKKKKRLQEKRIMFPSHPHPSKKKHQVTSGGGFFSKKKTFQFPRFFPRCFWRESSHDNSMASSWVPVGYLLLVLAFGTVLHPELKAFYRHGHGGTLERGICLHMVLAA